MSYRGRMDGWMDGWMDILVIRIKGFHPLIMHASFSISCGLRLRIHLNLSHSTRRLPLIVVVVVLSSGRTGNLVEFEVTPI
jgi:hypothetical protein